MAMKLMALALVVVMKTLNSKICPCKLSSELNSV